MKYCLVLTTLVLVWLQTSLVGLADDSQPEKKEERRTESVKKEVTINSPNAIERLNRRIALGDFRPGTTIECVVLLTNESPRVLEFNSIEKACNCLEVSPEAASLKPGSSEEIKITISTPSNSTSRERFVSLNFQNNQVTQMTWRLVYGGKGVVGFAPTAIDVEIPEGKATRTIRVPFFADEKSPEEFVDVEAFGGLANVEVAINFKERFIEIDLSRDLLVAGSLSGGLRITNIESGAIDNVFIDASEAAGVKLYPSLIRFQPTDEDDDPAMLQASIVVHDKSVDEPTVSQVSFSCGEKRLKSRLIRSRGGVGFYQVRADANTLSEAAVDGVVPIQCNFFGSTLKRTFQVDAVFED